MEVDGRGEVGVGLGVRRNESSGKVVNRMHSGQRLTRTDDSAAVYAEEGGEHSHLTVLVVLSLKVIRPVVWIEEKTASEQHNGGEKVRGSEDASISDIMRCLPFALALTACHWHAGSRAAAKT